MGLPWVRLDADFASHDKVLALVAHPSRARWQALASYLCALGWSGKQGTDGHIPPTALPFVHGTQVTARLLVEVRLWEEATRGWQIVNFGDRQQLALTTQAISSSRSLAGIKGNCRRYHGKDCWNEDTDRCRRA